MSRRNRVWIGGIDEAGYGPTLGPLVISLTIFSIQDNGKDIWERLSGLVANPGKKGKMHVGDSKRLYSRKRGIGCLERSVLSFCLATGASLPSDVREYLRRMGFKGSSEIFKTSWYGGRLPLPMSISADELFELANELTTLGEREGVLCEEAQILPLGEVRFNREIDALGNKGHLLFQQTGRLIRHFFERCSPGKLFVDRHGGRKEYLHLLRPLFAQASVRTVEKSDNLSRYEVRGRQEGEIVFLKRGEEYSFPVALASMFSKYTRELFMCLFNSYWAARAECVRPTAGYPTDAARFLTEIRPYLLEDEERLLTRIR